MKKMDSSVLQFACWFNPCFHPKVKVRTPAERFLKAKKSVRKDWPHQKETETSCQKDDCLWDEKNKMYSLENFRRDWHPVGNVVWRKLYKDKEMSEKRTESWADDGEGHTCAERKKAIPGHWLEKTKQNKRSKCHYVGQPTIFMTICVGACAHGRRQIREDYAYLIKIITKR